MIKHAGILAGILVVMLTGLALGWVAHERWGSEPGPDRPVTPIATLPSQPLTPEITTPGLLPAESATDNSLTALLGRGAYQAAVERYESLQDQPDDVVLEHYTETNYLELYLLGYTDYDILEYINNMEDIHEFYNFNEKPPSMR